MIVKGRPAEDVHHYVQRACGVCTTTHALTSIRAVENAMGRVRREKWGPRIIDLDILFYEDLVLQTSELILPHPDLHNRRFALRLLNELAPDLIHPVFKKSVATLLRGLDAAKEK